MTAELVGNCVSKIFQGTVQSMHSSPLLLVGEITFFVHLALGEMLFLGILFPGSHPSFATVSNSVLYFAEHLAAAALETGGRG